MPNPDSVHVLPGGQREAGETLKREVLEEAGWEVEAGEMIGCIHFHHLGPRPPGFSHAYPDFMQVVFLAEAARHVPQARRPDDPTTTKPKPGSDPLRKRKSWVSPLASGFFLMPRSGCVGLDEVAEVERLRRAPKKCR